MESMSHKSGLDITKGMVKLPEGLSARAMISEFFHSIRTYIENLIDKHVNELSGKNSVVLSPSDILYCLTIPIEWNEMQVNVMREAAFDAGYIETLDSDNLLFCHEPVAAAFSLVHRFKGVLTPNCRALVVDAGGGTVDFFMCKFSENVDEMAEVVCYPI